MSNNKIQIFLAAIVLFVASISTTHAQQLIREIDKSWKVHTGIIGGIGASNFLPKAQDVSQFMPESYTDYSVLYAPRPEFTVGFFVEMESCKWFSVRLSAGHMTRAIPKPLFSQSMQTTKNVYHSIYLNGFHTDLIAFINASDKIKVGLGIESAHYWLTKKIKEGMHADYADNFKMSHGLKAVFGYRINPRMEINAYTTVNNNYMNKPNINDISGGVAFAYRLCGKEIKMQKQIYRLDYTK